MISRKLKWTSIDSAGIAVCLLLTAAAGWIGFAPIWQRHTTFLQQQEDLQSKKQNNSAQEMALKATEKRLTLTQAQLEQIPLHLQPTTRLNQRLAAITDLAAANNLKIEDIKPGATVAGKRYDAVNIDVAGEGTYPACAAFLHHLKQSMPDVGIEDLHLVSEGTADAAAKFTFDLQWFAAASPDVATVQSP
jgi:Tfp pilus assembly protein PilO